MPQFDQHVFHQSDYLHQLGWDHADPTLRNGAAALNAEARPYTAQAQGLSQGVCFGVCMLYLKHHADFAMFKQAAGSATGQTFIRGISNLLEEITRSYPFAPYLIAHDGRRVQKEAYRLAGFTHVEGPSLSAPFQPDQIMHVLRQMPGTLFLAVLEGQNGGTCVVMRAESYSLADQCYSVFDANYGKAFLQGAAAMRLFLRRWLVEAYQAQEFHMDYALPMR